MVGSFASLIICHQMAANLLKFHIQEATTQPPPHLNPLTKRIPFPVLPFPSYHHFPKHHFHFHPPTTHDFRIPFLLHSSLSSSSSSSTPPTSKEEAILQAKTCLSTTLEKPLNNIKFSTRIKKAKQPRFRLEIPVIDESPASLSQLAFEVFGDLPIKRKGSPVKILILWSSPVLAEAAINAFKFASLDQLQQIDISSVDGIDNRILNSADVAVFLAPESSQLPTIKTVSDGLYPKPVVIFNPRWVFEDESGFGELSGFVGSFEVIYSFMGLEVRGILNKRKGVIFKCVRNGVLSGEAWNVLVEEEGGELKAVSKFKARPSISEVENVLYNLMATNSPITKSAKFLKDLVSNVTGKNWRKLLQIQPKKL